MNENLELKINELDQEKEQEKEQEQEQEPKLLTSQNRYYQRNKDKILNYKKDYYQRNKDKIKEQNNIRTKERYRKLKAIKQQFETLVNELETLHPNIINNINTILQN